MTYILEVVFRGGVFHLVDEAPDWLKEGQIGTVTYEVEEADNQPIEESE